MKSPDSYIRKAYLPLLNATGCNWYDMLLPKNITPVPNIYGIISTQTKRASDGTKCGHEWDCTILLDIISTFENGFADRSIIENIETNVLTAIDKWTFDKSVISIPPFTVYYTDVDDSHDDYLVTDTKTIIRKLIRFRHKISAVA